MMLEGMHPKPAWPLCSVYFYLTVKKTKYDCGDKVIAKNNGGLVADSEARAERI